MPFDDDPIGQCVPAQPERADPEFFDERGFQWFKVLGLGGIRSHQHLGVSTGNLIEEFDDLLGQQRRLFLLDRDADDAGSLTCLQVEGPVPRLPDSAHDESLRRVEQMYLLGHGHDPNRAARQNRPLRRSQRLSSRSA